jgi:hypothetical protein
VPYGPLTFRAIKAAFTERVAAADARRKIGPVGNFSHFAWFGTCPAVSCDRRSNPEATMNALIYLVGLVVVVLFILSLLGLR